METETKAATRLDRFRDGVEVRLSTGGRNTLVVDRADGEMVILADEALQKLVQWAYDVRGILAVPSIAAEAERFALDAAGLDKIAAGEA